MTQLQEHVNTHYNNCMHSKVDAGIITSKLIPGKWTWSFDSSSLLLSVTTPSHQLNSQMSTKTKYFKKTTNIEKHCGPDKAWKCTNTNIPNLQQQFYGRNYHSIHQLPCKNWIPIIFLIGSSAPSTWITLAFIKF